MTNLLQYILITITYSEGSKKQSKKNNFDGKYSQNCYSRHIKKILECQKHFNILILTMTCVISIIFLKKLTYW